MADVEAIQNLTESANKQLQSVLVAKNEELNRLRDKCTELENQYMELSSETSKLITMTQKRAEYEVIFKAGEQEIENLSSENESLKHATQREINERSTLNDQLEFTRITMAMRSKEIEEFQHALKMLKDENSKLSAELHRIQTAEEEIAIKQVEIEDAEPQSQRIENLYEGEIAKLKREVERLQDVISDMRATIEKNDQKIKTLDVKSQDCQDLIMSLEKEIDDLRVQADDLEREHLMQETAVQNLSSENARLRGVTIN